MHPLLHTRRATYAFATVALLALTLVFASTATAAGPQQYHGAQMHAFWGNQSAADNARELDLLAEAGADSVRVDLGWASIEADGKGQYNEWYVGRVDQFMAQARARNMKVVAALINSPCWASTAPDSDRQDCSGQWWNRGNIPVWAPRDANDYADAAAWVARRWQADLAGLEVWNEPNDSAYFRAADPVADYARLVRATYGPVKAAAPSVPVIVAAVSWSDRPWLERLYAQGIGGSYDAISIHPYNESRDPDDPWQPQWRMNSFLSGVKWVRELMVEKGDADKDLWLTEFGFSTCGTGSSVCVSPEKQAEYTKDSFRIAAGWSYVRGAFVYNMRNTSDAPNDRNAQFGLLNRDFSRKPAYEALKSALHEYYGPNAAAQADPDAATGNSGSGSGSGSRGSTTSTPSGTVSVIGSQGGAAIITDRRGVTKVRLSCKTKKRAGKRARCRGRLSLRAASRLKGYSVPRGSLGTARFSIPRGKTTVTVKLNSAARRLVNRVRRVRVTAVVAPANNTAKAASLSGSFLLKRI